MTPASALVAAVVAVVMSSSMPVLGEASTPPISRTGASAAGPVPNQNGYSCSAPPVVQLSADAVELRGNARFPPGYSPYGIQFEGATYANGTAYFVPRSVDMVVGLRTATGEMVSYSRWPSNFVKGGDAFFGGAVDGRGRLWMAPWAASHAVMLDPASGNMTRIEWPILCDPVCVRFAQVGGGFAGAVYDGKYIWIVPVNARPLMRINTETLTMTGFSNWPSGFTKGNNAFNSAVFDGTHVWLIPCGASSFVRVNPETGEMLAISTGWFEGYVCQCIGGLLVNGEVWCVPGDAPAVFILNPGTLTVRRISMWPQGFVKTTGAFIGAVFDGETVWMAPDIASGIVGVRVSTGEMALVRNDWPSGFTSSTDKFGGIVYDGYRFVLVPRTANMLVVVQPCPGNIACYVPPPPPPPSPTPSPARTVIVVEDAPPPAAPWYRSTISIVVVATVGTAVAFSVGIAFIVRSLKAAQRARSRSDAAAAIMVSASVPLTAQDC